MVWLLGSEGFFFFFALAHAALIRLIQPWVLGFLIECAELTVSAPCVAKDRNKWF